MAIDLLSVATPIERSIKNGAKDNISDYSCNFIANRKVEKSMSDISALSAMHMPPTPVTPPPQNNRRQLKFQLKLAETDAKSDHSGRSSISGMHVQAFNSNKRKQELSVSDNTSVISNNAGPRSPFLQLKETDGPDGNDGAKDKNLTKFQFLNPIAFTATDIYQR